MNTISVPPKSSTTTTMEEDQSENRDSCYYPGCRKDANCNCEICLASINATLDLMPSSFQKSSLTKLSSSRPSVKSTPISFDASILSTPRSSSCQIRSSPALKSTARLNVSQKMEKAKKKPDFWGNFFRLALGLSLILFMDFGLSWAVSGVLRPVLSPDIVKGVGEKSWVVQDLNGRLRFLQKELQGIVNGKVSNCSYANSVWEVSQDGLLLNSRCTLYKSATEEVSIWGWPLQTAGLLTTGFSCRSLTILSGRVTEWSDGQIGYLIRKANTSWVQKKLGVSAVQLDPNTWVLEYQRSSILDDLRLYSAASRVHEVQDFKNGWKGEAKVLALLCFRKQ
ncbi:ERG2/sigma1 receptor-like [Quillaja saponaria]|uniref:ERG2/sigma1 receptor-like n=1 Tax=Quillaja saponaria TaxID=32244 RepID=A0AAD7PH36_QUISA|nr:ERG2/sigma1 receptor-like [Quillaja saponaria]